MELVRELRDEGERCLIFTQYIGYGQDAAGTASGVAGAVLYLTGILQTARDRMIED